MVIMAQFLVRSPAPGHILGMGGGEDVKSFTVVVNYIRGRDAYSCSLPKPLEEHGLPESITFKERQ